MTGECHVILTITHAQRRNFTQTKMELEKAEVTNVLVLAFCSFLL